uniref:Uncharacterized protein n=1 Tax=Anguilla anguilla TaxID=7936 RepID=A0A0E9WF07_ANGAN
MTKFCGNALKPREQGTFGSGNDLGMSLTGLLSPQI